MENYEEETSKVGGFLLNRLNGNLAERRPRMYNMKGG